MVLDSTLVRRVRTHQRLRPLGIAAYRAFARVRPVEPGPRILANSIPKAGTHLMMSLLDAMPAVHFSGRHVSGTGDEIRDALRRDLRRLRSSQYLAAHLGYDPDAAAALRAGQVRHLLLVRDPRDVVVSQAAYIAANPLHPVHEHFVSTFAPDERIAAVVRGFDGDGHSRGVESLAARLGHYLGWLSDPGVCLVRFEDLVGSRGGGDDAAQADSVRRILEALGTPATPSAVEHLCARAYSPTSATFRRGRVGGWRDELGEADRQLVVDVAGPQLAMLGYPA